MLLCYDHTQTMVNMFGVCQQSGMIQLVRLQSSKNKQNRVLFEEEAVMLLGKV